MKNKKLVGSIIKAWRTKEKLTQGQVAELLYVTKQAVSAWENGNSLPGKDILEKLETEYVLNFQDTEIITGAETNMQVKALAKIDSFEEIQQVIHQIVNAVELDPATAVTIRKLLELALTFMTGCFVYYEVPRRKDIDPIDWSWVGSYLLDLIDTFDLSPMPRNSNVIGKEIVSAKLEYMLQHNLDCKLFEDTDYEKYSYKIGQYACDCGYYLLRVLPKRENTILSTFKVAILNLAELLEDAEEI